MNFFAGSNWRMKVVALIFAVVVYLYTARQVRQNETFEVVFDPAAVVGLPSDHRVANITPTAFSIEVSGPAATLRALRERKISPRLELSGSAIASGMQRYPLTTTLLGIDAEVRIIGTNPAGIDEVTIAIGKVEQASMWVEAPTLVKVPSGIRATMVLDRDRVTVTGPAQTLADLQTAQPRLRFKPVTLDGVNTAISEKTDIRVVLEPDTFTFAGVQVDDVTATVTMTPVGMRRQQAIVPLRMVVAPAFLRLHTVKLEQDQVGLSLRGPIRVMDELNTDDLDAWVDLRSLTGAGTTTLPVHAVVPKGVEAEPVTVAVTVTLRQPAELVPEEAR